MLEINNISKSYDNKNNVVSNLTFRLNQGEICGLLGPNGAGKTTTLKMITGILPPTAGNIKINNYDIVEQPLLAKKQFSFVPDSPNSFLRFKGIEYLKFMADIYEVSQAQRVSIVEELAAKFELSDVLNDSIKNYSHGMRQKIILIGALLHQPELLILDEPMTGLDPKSAYILKEIIRDYANKGKMVLFSSHVLDVVEKVCDTIAVIYKGELKFYGSLSAMKEHFKNNASLENMFLELTEYEG